MEIVARLLFKQTSSSARPCLITNDPSTGVRAIPNSSCIEKDFESQWVEYKFNSCGHRAVMECGPKRPGTFRIVMLGSSLAQGATVPLDKSFAAILPALLSKNTGRDIELYNEGMAYGTPHSVDLRFAEALTAQPDLLLWPISPWDIAFVDLTLPLSRAAVIDEQLVGASGWHRVKAELLRKRDLAGFLTNHSRAFFMMLHFLYKSDSIYLSHSLSATDEYAASLQDTPSQEWQEKLRRFDTYVADIAARAKTAGVPLVVMALPRHAQVVMISAGVAPPGVNPYAFGDQIKAIVEKNGATYIDILPQFRDVPNVSSAFYPIDQHLTVSGQQLVAQVIAKGLTTGAPPALAP
jgi:SGNH hydrolase-like domain, acetyltransferase AlgX